jgi:hypothetical protein
MCRTLVQAHELAEWAEVLAEVLVEALVGVPVGVPVGVLVRVLVEAGTLTAQVLVEAGRLTAQVVVETAQVVAEMREVTQANSKARWVLKALVAMEVAVLTAEPGTRVEPRRWSGQWR